MFSGFCRLVCQLSFGFSFGSWFGREMEWENFFGDLMQSEKGLFTTKTWGGGVLNCFVSFEETDLRCLLR